LGTRILLKSNVGKIVTFEARLWVKQLTGEGGAFAPFTDGER
jgi:hypothetical protein